MPDAEGQSVSLDQMIAMVGHDSGRARQALASGAPWTFEQRAWLESVAEGGKTATYQVASPAPAAFASASISSADSSSPTVVAATGVPAGAMPPGAPAQPRPAEVPLGPQPQGLAPRPWYDPAPEPRKRKPALVVAAVLGVLALIGAGGAAAWTYLADRGDPAVSAESPGAPADPSASAEPGASAGPSSQAVADTAAPGTLRAGYGSYVCSSTGKGVRCWGANLSGETLQPAAVAGLEDVQVAALSAGRGFAVAVAQDGTVYAWGANDAGQLGADGGQDGATAVSAGSLPKAPSQLVSGTEHTCALVDGEVYCFGANRYGQVTGAETQGPTAVTKVEGVSGALSIGTSGYDTWALTADGAWSWGNNTWGQVNEEASKAAAPTFTPDK